MANNLLGMLQELICAKVLKKDYEKAAQMQRERELEEKEEEKRLRRERAEERARQAEEARKNKNRKKEKEESEDKVPASVREASRVGIRQYARGRAYDPNRYGTVTPYHEDVAAGILKKIEELPEEEAPAEIPAPEEEAVVEAPVEETVISTGEASEEPETGTPKED